MYGLMFLKRTIKFLIILYNLGRTNMFFTTFNPIGVHGIRKIKTFHDFVLIDSGDLT